MVVTVLQIHLRVIIRPARQSNKRVKVVVVYPGTYKLFSQEMGLKHKTGKIRWLQRRTLMQGLR